MSNLTPIQMVTVLARQIEQNMLRDFGIPESEIAQHALHHPSTQAMEMAAGKLLAELEKQSTKEPEPYQPRTPEYVDPIKSVVDPAEEK